MQLIKCILNWLDSHIERVLIYFRVSFFSNFFYEYFHFLHLVFLENSLNNRLNLRSGCFRLYLLDDIIDIYFQLDLIVIEFMFDFFNDSQEFIFNWNDLWKQILLYFICEIRLLFSKRQVLRWHRGLNVVYVRFKLILLIESIINSGLQFTHILSHILQLSVVLFGKYLRLLRKSLYLWIKIVYLCSYSWDLWL